MLHSLNNFCGCEINVRNGCSMSRIGKQKLLHFLRSLIADPFKLSESQARANNLPALSSSETNPQEVQAAAPGTPAVQSHTVIWEFKAAFRTPYKSVYESQKVWCMVIKKSYWATVLKTKMLQLLYLDPWCHSIHNSSSLLRKVNHILHFTEIRVFY